MAKIAATQDRIAYAGPGRAPHCGLSTDAGEPLWTLRWGNAVHATLTAQPAPTGMSTHPFMDLDELKRLGAAAFWAKRICLGPVGELLSRELRSWEEFGYRLGTQGMTIGIVDAVLKARDQQSEATRRTGRTHPAVVRRRFGRLQSDPIRAAHQAGRTTRRRTARTCAEFPTVGFLPMSGTSTTD